MTNTMTDDRKALLINLLSAVVADGDYEIRCNDVDHQNWFDLRDKLVAELSAQPSPDAAQREPKCATCGDTELAHSSEWDSGYPCPDCAQPAKDEAREVAVPTELLMQWWADSFALVGPTLRAQHIVDQFVVWDRQNRAASAGKPVAWRFHWLNHSGQHDGQWVYRDHSPDALHEQGIQTNSVSWVANPSKVDWQPLYTHPPAAAVSSVQDEVARAVASMETPPEVKGRVMSEMFWKGVYALQSFLSRTKA